MKIEENKKKLKETKLKLVNIRYENRIEVTNLEQFRTSFAAKFRMITARNLATLLKLTICTEAIA